MSGFLPWEEKYFQSWNRAAQEVASGEGLWFFHFVLPKKPKGPTPLAFFKILHRPSEGIPCSAVVLYIWEKRGLKYQEGGFLISATNHQVGHLFSIKWAKFSSWIAFHFPRIATARPALLEDLFKKKKKRTMGRPGQLYSLAQKTVSKWSQPFFMQRPGGAFEAFSCKLSIN
jgi:hypothetical protein